MSSIDAYLGGLNAFGKNYVDAPEGGVPDVDNAKEVIGDVKTIRVNRKVFCLKTDGIDVEDDLRANEDDLKIYVGKDSPLDFGSGYRLIDANADPLKGSMMSLACSYEKEVQGIFDSQLPPSVTVTCVNGVVTMLFNGSPMESWDTGKECKEQPLRVTGKLWTKTEYRVELFANDVRVEDYNFGVSGDLDPENNDDHYMHWEWSGSDWAQLVLLGTVLFRFDA